MSILVSFFAPDLSYSNRLVNRITIVGTAVVMKNDAAVRTDDNDLYYLDGIFDWDDEFLGKRVKVTGKLVIKEYEIEKVTDSVIKVRPQQRLGTWKIIMKSKWSLVK